MGMIGRPVALANWTTPTLATWRGPFGPSGVTTRLPPARPMRINSRKASAPPLVLEPRTACRPNRAAMRRINSPSRCRLIKTWASNPRRASGIINCWACQKAMIIRFPCPSTRSTCSIPSRRNVMVRLSKRMMWYPTGGTTATLTASAARLCQDAVRVELPTGPFCITRGSLRRPSSLRKGVGKLQGMETFVHAALPQQFLV